MGHKIIISGGGTGGHIFPAIAIANALRRLKPDIEILFVGAKGRMEMEKVPAAGYEIVGLDIQGLDRQSWVNNLVLPFKLIKSFLKARKVIKNFGAEVAIGVGGYASGPLLFMANRLGIPTLIQEQNSYAGKTNKFLGREAQRICVAYTEMEQFFPAGKILLTGNPIRRSSVELEGKKKEALTFFGLEEGKKTVLVTGGSLGARTLNDFMLKSVEKLVAMSDVQFIWQCGNVYYDDLKSRLHLNGAELNISLTPFLERIDYAYAAADIIIARAGAGTISELCMVGKPAILVPSPNVAEDHQTKNAQALVKKGAALMIADDIAQDNLLEMVLGLLSDEEQCAALSREIKKLALPDADEVIAKEVLKLIA